MRKKLALAAAVLLLAVVSFVAWQAVVGVSFERRLEVEAPPAAVWAVLVASFEDSTTSPVWPQDLERLSTPKLEEGAVVEAAYLIGETEAEQSYRIAAFDADGRRFRYLTRPGHPLEGGATVEVKAADDGALIHWSGHYDVSIAPRAQFSAAFTRYYFTGRFFDGLEARLHSWAASRP